MSDIDHPAVPVHGPGLLGNLGKRRQQISDAAIRTIQVPRWSDPEIHLRFRPMSHTKLKEALRTQESAVKSKDPRRMARVELDVNADLLVDACEEVVLRFADGTEIGVGPDGAITGIDHNLAAALEMPDNVSARLVCQHIFISEADLLAAARDIAEWSGYGEDAIDAELAGES